MRGGNDKAHCVLLAEDDSDLRKVVSNILREEGYEVASAADGWQALDLLRGDHLPDVIVLDLLMPVMTGWEFLTELRHHPRWSAIPVIALSAVPGSEHDARTLGVAAYLNKPVAIDVLLNTIGRVLESGLLASYGEGKRSSR